MIDDSVEIPHPRDVEIMLEELLPSSVITNGPKFVYLDIGDIEAQRKNVDDRRVYATRYGRLTLKDLERMDVVQLARYLNALERIIKKESLVSSINERT